MSSMTCDHEGEWRQWLKLYRSMKLMIFDLTKMISPKGHTDACSLVIISLISPRALSTVGDL
ncbi:hypothetical protein BDA96_08G117800 [Sorghum bicolor]|uniref:Uncharacterized protein n=1 Tax=Sorghum bicolor TaxID=4558 RepID=A0A921QFL8_SORBI|nr:hypothetical protein BDA96_08G117800 [Sorghum bicolor]